MARAEIEKRALEPTPMMHRRNRRQAPERLVVGVPGKAVAVQVAPHASEGVERVGVKVLWPAWIQSR